MHRSLPIVSAQYKTFESAYCSNIVRDSGVDLLCKFEIRQLADPGIALFNPQDVGDTEIAVHPAGLVKIIKGYSSHQSSAKTAIKAAYLVRSRINRKNC